MLLNTNELLRYSIHAADGDIGKVIDFYFDDRHWTIRYLLVDVGNWLKDRKVLVSPMSIKMVAVNLGRFMASVTRQQVENSPSWDNQKPVSRQYEELFAKYYDYPYYWGGPYLWGYAPNPAGITLMEANIPQDVSVEEAEAEIEKSHLRSTREIIGYHLVTTDGEIGQVVDFIFAEKNWQFHYLVIDTGKWPANRKTLISPDWIGLINWSKSQVSVQFDKETIRNAPTYDDLVTITPDYEKRLFAYYGRPGYWQTPAERQ